MLNAIGLLLAPSIFSLVMTGILIIILSAGTLIKYGLHTKTLYDLILGAGSSPDLVNKTQNVFNDTYSFIFGNGILNKVLFFVFWMIIGLIVYGFVTIIGHEVEQANEIVREQDYAHVVKSSFWHQHLERFGVHLLVAVVVGLYSLVFVKFLLPFSLLSIQIGTATLPEISALGYGILGLIVLGLGLHTYVVLLRLLTLRIRVFGSGNV